MPLWPLLGMTAATSLVVCMLQQMRILAPCIRSIGAVILGQTQIPCIAIRRASNPKQPAKVCRRSVGVIKTMRVQRKHRGSTCSGLDDEGLRHPQWRPKTPAPNDLRSAACATAGDSRALDRRACQKPTYNDQFMHAITDVELRDLRRPPGTRVQGPSVVVTCAVNVEVASIPGSRHLIIRVDPLDASCMTQFRKRRWSRTHLPSALCPSSHPCNGSGS